MSNLKRFFKLEKVGRFNCDNFLRNNKLSIRNFVFYKTEVYRFYCVSYFSMNN